MTMPAAVRRGRLLALLLLLAAPAVAQQRLAQPLRLVVASDSTASAYDASRWPRRGWGQELPGYFDNSVEVRNRAQSGRSARSFIEQGWIYDVARDLRPGDLLLIQFGHNDEKQDDPARYNEPRRAFPFWLGQYLALARAAGARPVLLTPVARRHFVAGEAVDLHGHYAEAVRALAQREGVDLVDLNRASLRWLAGLGEDASRDYFLHVPEQGLRDNTHFHQRGAAAMACLVAQALVRQGLLQAQRLRRDIDCGLPQGEWVSTNGRQRGRWVSTDGSATAGGLSPGWVSTNDATGRQEAWVSTNGGGAADWGKWVSTNDSSANDSSGGGWVSTTSQVPTTSRPEKWVSTNAAAGKVGVHKPATSQQGEWVSTNGLHVPAPPDGANGSRVLPAADQVGLRQPGPHGGGGETVAYPLFADAPDLRLILRRRVLPPGAGIGLHRHDKDEIYYVLSGQGRYVLDGAVHAVGPGDALLTRAGSSHALHQTGDADLVILINYLK
jgi:lysophospholipase L1-like esterase/quercetin dioxygenase-like cupin family protein